MQKWMLQIKSLDVFQRAQDLCSNLIYQALKIRYSILRVVIVYLYYQENHERKVSGERRRVRKLDLDETSIAHLFEKHEKETGEIRSRFGGVLSRKKEKRHRPKNLHKMFFLPLTLCILFYIFYMSIHLSLSLSPSLSLSLPLSLSLSLNVWICLRIYRLGWLLFTLDEKFVQGFFRSPPL